MESPQVDVWNIRISDSDAAVLCSFVGVLCWRLLGPK